jgi:hypothetical protein
VTAQFLPYSSRGLAALPASTDATDGRRHVTPALSIVADGRLPTDAHPSLPVLGPGDVIGVDLSRVTRRTPRPDEPDMSPNHLASIEFDHPDLPWLYTADPDVHDDRIMPWLMLVVVDEQPGEQLIAPPPEGVPNPSLTVDGSRLPAPEDAWAFAHVQVEGADAEAARMHVAGDGPWPLARSRLLAPCVLQAGTAFVVCLLPVYEAGRRAGLNQPPGDASGHWSRSGSVTLPVYDHWRFRTGESGDFESLALALQVPHAFECGFRQVVVDDLAARLRRPDDPTLFTATTSNVGTALSQNVTQTQEHPPALTQRLTTLLDTAARSRPADGGPPIVGPPMYGQWPAGVESLDAQEWVRDLNTDPALRAVAGLGARMVQVHQEELMAEAWAQLQAVDEANGVVRWAQVAALATTPLHDALAIAPPAQALRIANASMLDPTVGALPDEAIAAVAGELATSNVPEELFSPAFVHVARHAMTPALLQQEPGAPIEEDWSVNTIVDQTFELLQAGSAEVAPEPVAAFPSPDLERLKAVVEQSGLAEDVLASAMETLAFLQDADTVVDGSLGRTATVPELMATVATTNVIDGSFPPMGRVVIEHTTPPEREVELSTADRWVVPTQSVESAALQMASPAQARFVERSWRGEQAALRALGLPDLAASSPLDRLGRAVTVTAGDLTRRPPSRTVLPASMDALTTALDPRSSYTEMLAERITIVEDAPTFPSRRTPFDTIVASPQFLTPTVEWLATMDRDWVLGGLARIEEENLIAVLSENQRFVEAFLAGANHEMARELRWRGYPVNRRGSFFRRFWPTFTEDPDAEGPLIRDVTPLDQWTAPLGQNREAQFNDLLVVVLKGALLRRYPNTILTVELGTHDPYTFTGSEVPRLASGTIEPDFAYVIFEGDLDDEVAGNRLYVSLREPSDEPSFGLTTDDAATPRHLTARDALWESAANAGTSLAPVATLFRQPFRLLLALRELYEVNP